MRRIRCLTTDDSTDCTGCLTLGEKCTRERIRKKSGPKNGRRSRSLPDHLAEFSEASFLAEIHHGRAGQGVNGMSFLEHPPKKEGTNTYEVSGMLPANMAAFPPARAMTSMVDSRLMDHMQPQPQQQHQQQIQQHQLHQLQQQQPQQQQQSPRQMHELQQGPFHTPPNLQALPAFNILHHQLPIYHQYPIQPPRPAQPQYVGHVTQPQYSTYQQHVVSPEIVNMAPRVPLQDEPVVPSGIPPPSTTTSTPLDEHEDILAAFKTSASPHMARIPLQCLIRCVQVFQTWFYGCWPVLSLGNLILEILGRAQTTPGGDFIPLTPENAMLYALCCAVCAATTTQLSFVSPENVVLDQSSTSDVEYAAEALRVRNLFDYTNKIEVDTLLSSFFLYAHYTNQKGKIKQAQMYLREAISMAQILGFHEKSQYGGKSRGEVHRWRKIYYTLLVTERYVCFEGGLPVILEPCIPFPELSDEEYPQLLTGFSELIKIFSVPSKEFFFEMNQNRHENITEEKPLDEKRQWILAVQESLGTLRQVPKNVSHPQKLNIILSKAWIRAIACHITWNNGMLRLLEHTHDCFGFDFPLVNAQEFLMESSYLPNMAFETNGPGICVKLLEMANSLSFTVQQSLNQRIGLSVLESLFGLVNKFKNDVTLPIKVYQGIANLIARHKLKVVPRLIESHDPGYMSHSYQPGTIEELLEDEVGEPTEEPVKDEFEQVELSSFSRRSSDHGIGMLSSVPSFLNVGYHQLDPTPPNQS